MKTTFIVDLVGRRGSKAVPATVIPLLSTPTAGHISHCIRIWASTLRPGGKKKYPARDLCHRGVQTVTPPAADLPCRGALYTPGELALADSPGRVLFPQPLKLLAGHLLCGHPSEGLGRQRAAQQALAEVTAFGVPEVGHLAPDTGLVFGLVGSMEVVDTLLYISGQR